MSTIKNYMEKSRYINPTEIMDSGKKKKRAVKLSSLSDCCLREPPILLFDVKTYQLAADASSEHYKLIIVVSNQTLFPEQKIWYSGATCEEQNYQHPLCTTFKKASLNGKTNSSSTKPMLTTSEYLSPISRFTNKTSSMPL